MGFREALAKYDTEAALLSIVRFWVEDFAPEARRKLIESTKRKRMLGAEPVVVRDGGGRYALAEALKCLGYVASRENAEKAAALANADADDALGAWDDAEWRQRFVRFIERSWECPITSPFSPF